jgi:prepilin-type N-terminal cleavage/methylation domain-containing protein
MDSGRLQKLKLDNKGFSIVEMLCAIVILTMVTAAISTIVLVSTKVYKNEVSETNVQQEAQLAANRISEIIKDAVSVTITKASDTEGSDKEGSDKVGSDKVGSDLKIIKDKKTNEGYRVYLASDNNLMFETISGDGTSSDSEAQVLAGNITEFSADISEFENSNIVKITFKVQSDINDNSDDVSNDSRNYTASYVMKARNEDSNEASAELTSYVSVSGPSVLYLEPGQTFTMDIDASENVTKVEVDNKEKLKTGITVNINDNKAEIVVDSTVHDDLDRELDIKVSDNKGATATLYTKILIRRVNSLEISYIVDNRETSGDMKGLYEGKGTIFTFYANVNDQNIRKNVNSDGKTFGEYMSTKKVEWSISAEIKNEDGSTKVMSTQEEVEKYLVKQDVTSSEDVACVQYKVVKDLPENFSFTVTAKSLHQAGKKDGVNYNKSGSRYSDMDGNLVIEGANKTEIKDSVTISARKRNKSKVVTDFFYIETDVIIVEPGQGQDAEGDTEENESTEESESTEENEGMGENDDHGGAVDYEENVNTTDIKIPFYINAKYVTNLRVYLSNADNADTLITDLWAEKGSFNFDNNPERKFYLTYTKPDDITDESTDEEATILCYIKIRIDKDMSSLTNNFQYGYFQLTFTPIRIDDDSYTKTVEMRTRRVNKVTLSVKDGADINALNKSGSDTIVLEASPTGFSETSSDDSVEFYGQQPYEWDENYESPYKMEWGFIEKDGTYKEIDELVDEYIEIDTAYYEDFLDKNSGYKYSDDGNYLIPNNDDKESGHNAIFAFKIIKKLPEGKIRAISLHSLGSFDGKKYNKSGNSYSGSARGVYGDLVIGNAVTLMSVDTDYVDVEPGQGYAADGSDNDSTVVDIPFYIAADNLSAVNLYFDGDKKSSYTKIKNVTAEEGKGSFSKGSNDYYSYIENGDLKDEKSDTVLCHILLQVGENETGNNGVFKLYIQSYDKSGSDTYKKMDEISIRIRKVNEVSLSVTAPNGNEVGSEVTIKASPTGYGTNGDDYFSKSSASWDKGYKSPYAIRWTYIDSNDVERDIKELANITILEQDDATGKLSFTIKQKLDTGIKIKATSLHSLGTNKSGNSYGGDDGVYNEVVFVGDSVGVDVFEVASKEVSVKAGKESEITFYLDVEDIYRLSVSLPTENIDSNTYIEYVYINGQKITDKSAFKYIDDWRYLSNASGILECKIKIKIGEGQKANFDLTVEAYKRPDYNNAVKSESVTLKIN